MITLLKWERDVKTKSHFVIDSDSTNRNLGGSCSARLVSPHSAVPYRAFCDYHAEGVKQKEPFRVPCRR